MRPASSEPPAKRPSSRGLVHPAYAPLDVPAAKSRGAPKRLDEPALQVVVRMRDSGRVSPCIATPTHRSPVAAWRPQAKESVSPMYCSPVNPPNYEFPSSAIIGASKSEHGQVEPIPSTVVHRSLSGRCHFIPFPTLVPFEIIPPPTPSFSLFIGQVRFETTPAELVWLFCRICGASVVTVETRGTGCFIVHLNSDADRSSVLWLHKRVLFDVGGVWLARTGEEVDSLCEYVTLEGPYLSRQAKLPRDSMVVEYVKVDSSDATPKFHVRVDEKFVTGLRRKSSTSSKSSTPTKAQFSSNFSLSSLTSMPPSYPRLDDQLN